MAPPSLLVEDPAAPSGMRNQEARNTLAVSGGYGRILAIDPHRGLGTQAIENKFDSIGGGGSEERTKRYKHFSYFGGDLVYLRHIAKRLQIGLVKSIGPSFVSQGVVLRVLAHGGPRWRVVPGIHAGASWAELNLAFLRRFHPVFSLHASFGARASEAGLSSPVFFGAVLGRARVVVQVSVGATYTNAQLTGCGDTICSTTGQALTPAFSMSPIFRY